MEMDESEDNMSSEDTLMMESPFLFKTKPKKRSLVERELETNLTARVTSPVTNCDTGCTSRYGRARRLKTDADYIDTEKGIKIMTSPAYVTTSAKIQSPVYKMHASNSPIKTEPKETPNKVEATDSSLDSQIENIYHENISLSRFGSDEKKNKSAGNTFPKVYVRKDLIQSREKEEYVMMIKNMFSPVKSSQKSSSHLNNILERTSEKYCLNSSTSNSKSHNGFLSNSSVVKTLDFDNKKKKKENRDGKFVPSKSDLFDLEAQCEYQVGDLAWARMGTFPFWPCIVTREPASGMFVKKKLFGRIERDVIHVTFFGDNGRRGWIVDTMLRRFLGQLEFEATREAFSPSAKKKDPRLYAAFFVSEKRMPQWNISVEEAETLLREPKRLRIDILYDMLAKARSSKCTPKQQKSEKINRTVSDVASDVSLSESLYDTLFSEDDGKSEDTERSRSKTRMSLDVSEVVTACLDNMAAKTGITKIQRQSHMDRWLQKAKSKTPEKLQANVPPQQNEKEIKVASAKKKKKISLIRVPVQKPYSFRKSSYEPQILKSHDNEHDYSTKISNNTPQTSNENNVTADFGVGLTVKAELLHDEAVESVDGATKRDQTIKDIDTASVAPRESHTDVTTDDNTKNTIEIGPIDITEEQIDEIQVNMCSVEENDELLLGHAGKLIELTQIIDEPSKGKEESIETKQIANKPSLDTKKQSGIVKMPNNVIINADKPVITHENKDVTESAEIALKTDKHTPKTKKSIEVTQKIAEHSIDTEKQLKIAQIPDVPPMNTKKTTENAHVAAIESKILSDSRKNSVEFVKYLELRQDSLMDEHPDLSQDEIKDYLYKTWQYEESSNSDSRTNDNNKQSGLVKGLKTKKNKKSLSLNFNSKKKSYKKQDDDKLPNSANSFLSGTSFTRSLKTRLSNSPSISNDTNKRISSVIKDCTTAKAIESIQIVTEHSYTEKHPETTQNLNKHSIDTSKILKVTLDKEEIDNSLIEGATPFRRSLRAKLSKSPAVAVDTNEIKSSTSKESSSVKIIESTQIVAEHFNTKEHPESKQSQDEIVLDTPKRYVDKGQIETLVIDGGTPLRRSLRTQLSNSPMETNEIISSLTKKSSTVKANESTHTVNEHCYTEIHLQATQQLDQEETDSSKRITHNIDKEKIETSLTECVAPVRRSLRAKLSKSPVISLNSNEMVTSVSKETSTVKVIECNQTVTEHCYTKMTQKLDEHEIDIPKLSKHNVDKEIIETSLIESSTPVRRSLRPKLSKPLAISMDSNEMMPNVSKESSTVKAIECNQTMTDYSYTESNHETTAQLDEHEIDLPKLSKCYIDKEITETSLIECGTSVRRSLRTKVSNSLALDTNSITSRVNKESSTSKAIEITPTVTEHCQTEKLSETTQNLYDLGMDTPKLSEYNMDKEKKETTLFMGGTSSRRSLRSKLPNFPAISLDTCHGIMNSVSKERSKVNTKRSTQIVTENSSTGKNSETMQKLNEHKMDAKLSEYNIKKEKIETTLIVGDISVRRSLRTRFSNSRAMSMDTNETTSSISKENSRVKAIESAQIKQHLCSEKHLETTQKPDENRMGTPIQGEHNIKIEKATAIVDERDTSAEEQTEIIRIADEPRINRGKQVDTILIMDEHSSKTEKQVGTTLVKDEYFVNIEKVTDEPRNDTEKPFDAIKTAFEHSIKTKTRAEAIQKADRLNISTKISIETTSLTHGSCISAEKSKQTDVIKKSDGLTAHQVNSINIMEITDPSCKGSKKAIDVTQSVNSHSIDTKNQTPINKHTYGHIPYENKDNENKEMAEEPSIRIEKQAKMMLVVDEHPIKNDQAFLDEDKEYGHIDFVFSGLNEKLFATADMNKSVIENNENLSNNEIVGKDFGIAESNVINSDKKAPNNKPNLGHANASTENRIEKCVNSFPNAEETNIINLDKCKYKHLYDSCTNLRVRVERLPRLSHKVINIKDLENKIVLGNARQNEVINKIDIKNKNSKAVSKILSEDLDKKGNDDASCIAHATDDNEILNAAITIDKENEVKSKMNVDNALIGNIVNNKSLENAEANIIIENKVDSKTDYPDSKKVVSNKISDEKVISDKQADKNIVAEMNTLAKKDLLLDDIEHNNLKIIQPVTIVKQETVVCVEKKPSPISNGYEYIFDDDEDEFESPAFSPIFKEPIDTPGEKENETHDSKHLENASDKNDTNIIDNSVLKNASTESPLPEELISEENKNLEVAKSNDINALKIKNSESDKDELMTSVSRLPEPVKINGFHLDEYGLDFSDNDFNVETSSINSEDSEPLAVTKSKLLFKKRKDAKKALQDIEFIKYMELRQDALMDEHPELNQDEIVDYLYKTWHYEENAKPDIVKNDDIEQAGLVKGLNENLRQKSIRNSYRENKKRNKKSDDDTLSISSNISKKRSKKRDEDTLSINSDISDSSIRQRLRTRLSNSPAISMDENEICVSKESSPERKPHIVDTMSIDSDDSIKITKRKVRNQILDDSLDGDDSFFVLNEKPKSKDESTVKITIKTEETRPRRTLEKRENKSPKSDNDSNIKKYFSVLNSATETKTNHKNEQDTIDISKKIKKEYDPDTVSITSINSEDSEVSLSKRKPRKNAEKQTVKTMDDSEFLKYVELRQDVLIDENPQLTHEEIVAYLYKTWLYEESVKSDLKKSDDIEQANLVKGLNTEVLPKKVKKKIKVEKYPIDEDMTLKDKPRRKISQPYYCEDIMSDIEDEIELFEIFKTAKKPNAIKSEESNADINKTNDIKSSDVKTEVEEMVIHDQIDEVELYFSELPQPKPNVFKGFVREKVCEICEKTGNLVKCKGCSGMFHVNCEMKVQEEGVVASTRGRKKKKKPGRKPKNFEDSESHSDEKSQDVSEENNVSIEEIETEPRVVDEAVFEAALSAKMKELLPTIDLTYDSYSSDDGLDWNSALPGQCEIVDVKLKPKTVIDYSDFKCSNCQMYSIPVCFVCKEAVSKMGIDHRQKCQTNHCNKYYHLECLDHWPQTQFNSGEPSKSNKKTNEHFEPFSCPRHVCHTCVSDDPRGCKTRFSGDKLARCVKCPATYHSFTKCLPAGTQILTGSLIVCPRHYEQRSGKVPCHVNTGWCFICALGGSLICCEYCPTSFHAECLNIKPPEGGYMCEDCETGRLPLYGEMVWVKLGHYRWWPGIILHPSEIPENIMAVKHYHGEFVVRFFGQYDHYWVNRGRVFPFQEGDSGRISTQKSKIDAAFITAMEHAHRAFDILKNAQPNDEESLDIASSLLPPHYVKLKVNKPCGSLVGRRPDIEESSLTQCECDPQVEDPCGPYSHCLNRMLLTECGPICRAGDRCSNRAFEKRLYPKMVPYRTPHRGWGLKTLEDIRAGQFVIEYVGELLDEEEFKRRMNRMHEIRDENFYFLTLDKERMIDAGPKGNLARFMNHCCEPNCETQKWTVLGDVRVGLFAIYDIPANSELTFNYNLECTGIEKKRCMCGARRCSGYIGAKPKQDETQPKKKRAYKKRAKPVEESPSSIKNKPKRPVGRPAKPRELTEIEKDLLIIKNATNGISSDSESSSRLSSIDNPNPKALKRKRVSFSTEESVCSSPSTKKMSEESSPSTKKAKIEDSSPSTKKAKIEDRSPSTMKAKIEDSSPSTMKAKIEDSSPSTKNAKIEDSSPSTKKAKIEDSSPSTKNAKIEDSSPSTKKGKSEDTVTNAASANKLKIEEKSDVGD